MAACHKHSSGESDAMLTLGSNHAGCGGGHVRESSSKVVKVYTDSTTSEYKRLKICKRGYREAMMTRVCGVSFEGLPVWLWAMRLGEWSTIYISEMCEVKLRQYHAATRDLVHSKLIIMNEGAMTGISAIEVWLVSGTLDFVTSLEGKLGPAMVGWISDSTRRGPRSENPRWLWTSVAHSRVGGVTKATGWFGSFGLDKIVVPEDPIRRTIGHIVKYSERPSPCILPVREGHYVISDRLSLHRLDLPVVFLSGFSRTGWGKRNLTHAELEHAFELPSFVSWEAVQGWKLLPLQLFRVVLDIVLGGLAPAVQERGGPRQKLALLTDLSVDPLPLDAEWLPGLGRWLPGSWTDTAIANKAVKSDNADIDFYPWNQRIMLVLPKCIMPRIASFENLAMRRWCRALTMSFIRYLVREHGSNWSERLRLRGYYQSKVEQNPGPPFKKLKDHESTARSVVIDNGGCGCRAGGVESDLDELERDVTKGRMVLHQVLQSKWWEWSHGSALIFWRWTGPTQQVAARDGMRMFVQSALPVARKRKMPMKLSPSVKVLVADKIDGMSRRFYLESSGHVANLVDYFAVPKGDFDIRVVFDGSSCGLNDTLWAPNFFLPSANAASLLLTFQTWMSDMDFGEMFHNFPMEERMRRFAGIEVLESQSSGGGRSTKLLRWTRLFMGMRPSPYNAVRYYYWGEEFARGNPSDAHNPLGYDVIRLNLPGMSEFDPLLPKVMKWRSDLGVVAGDVVTFVDDVRITGYSKENCRNVHHQFASRIQYLGMQDAPRKFRPPSQTQAGAWTGTIFRIDSSNISKSVSQEKWNKAKGMVDELLQTIRASIDRRPQIDRKRLEKETGFLNHLAMTFDVVRPFLKGYYLTLNSWRSKRDHGDWKLSDKRWRRMLFDRFESGGMSEFELDKELLGKDEAAAPTLVRASISLARDVEALASIFSPSVVPVVSVRSRRVVTVVYGFGDASGTGLGATFTCGESGLNFRIGVWGSVEDPESSNWKEFTNVVEALEEEGNEGNLDNAEVFMFTDNSTVESCVSRGSSSSEKLLELVVRLQALSLRVGIKIHVFHIAGTRMIAQGTDGVSRGFLGQGVMDGAAMSVFVPIHLSAVERSPLDLVPWIWDWVGKEAILLDEMGWFNQGHDVEGWVVDPEGFSRPVISNQGKTFIWAPAPMAAEVALAEMRKARIKRQQSAHVFVCPRLCTGQWLRHLYRAADFVFELPLGSDMWPKSMHEPLLIGILFPFIRAKPWQLRGTPKMYAMGRQLRQVFQETPMDAGHLLRQFWSCCINLEGMSEPLVRKLLYFK